MEKKITEMYKDYEWNTDAEEKKEPSSLQITTISWVYIMVGEQRCKISVT